MNAKIPLSTNSGNRIMNTMRECGRCVWEVSVVGVVCVGGECGRCVWEVVSVVGVCGRW